MVQRAEAVSPHSKTVSAFSMTRIPSTSPATQPPLPFTEEAEQAPRNEADDIERILEIIRQTLRRQFQTTGRFRRDVHVKTHGCARGEFQVRANLPLELAQGLF